MRGLIYKETCLFFKSIEKRLLLLVTAILILLMFQAGIYAGLMASIMLSMTIGMQCVLSFSSDEKANWIKYQLAFPLNNFSVVASKYISVIYIIGFGLMGTLVINLLSSLIHNNWNLILWGLSAVLSIIVPLIWTGICLPLTYWFGFRSAQTMGLICVFPMISLIKFFEDGPGLSALPERMLSYLFILCIAALIIYIVSYNISVAGYSRKK